ncbi:AAA domain-containing protein [Bradyrhizobium cosmicum]|uniref:AAA domain-containing protein n=1 Tax=Bradyrhizobium cosmicum TaxID=1404864 RepID=UPI001164DBE7|nr:AAA domain-containing protein [Bradyrhizobium cosmicum]QDP27338.1 AAA family ATPase [Bradyrhizobium cosmicum]
MKGDAARPGRTGDLPAERLVELLDYVGQVIKLDERPACKLSEHRLANGQSFIFHQHELHSLPGITHDLVDDDGAVWLCAERLKRNDPPPPSETLAPWLELTPDPDSTPQPRDHILLTVAKPECDELVATGQARAEDCAESLAPDAKGQFDVRLRLEDKPGIAAEAEQYVTLSWLPWSIAERPRRRSMALYQKLFEVVQLSELGGAEQTFELVWGIGLSRWVKDGAVIDLPLIERLVEIEIDERAAGTIRIRPRQAPATVNLRPYDELKIDGVPVAQDAARRAIATVDEDMGVGPFNRDTFEPVLRSCQTRLDPEGTYLPDTQQTAPGVAPPAPSQHLVVSDRWVFFARRRSDNFLLQDLANLKASVEGAPDDLPGPSRTLVMGPARAAGARWKPLSDAMGAVAGGGAGPSEADPTPLGDLFFPKPFNDEQVEIVRRLEVNDGVVVQGPPGTGKTHTISNIICHYLAQGRRVLVVSHGEAALAVLRDQLPEQVRDLAISITTSEKEGYKQLEGAVRLLQSIVESLRPNEQLRLIADLEASIIDMRGRIRAIDAEIGTLAARQLSAVPGQKIRPAELAAAVISATCSHDWFTDRPAEFSAQVGVSDDDIARIRSARVALGARIEHLQGRLPSSADLPSGRALAHLHADILRADEYRAQAKNDPSVALRINSAEALDRADRAADGLDMLLDACRHLDAYPFLRPLCVALHSVRDAPFDAALRSFLSEAAGVLAEHRKFLETPVAVPEEAVSSPEIFEAISRLAAGERVFGVFAFKQKALKPAIDAIRILSRAPASEAEWTHVRDYLSWRGRFLDAQLRWRGLAPELGADAAGFASLRQLSELTVALNDIMIAAPKIHGDFRTAMRVVAVGETQQLWPDEQRMRAMRTLLRNAASAVRLAAAREEVNRLSALFGPAAGKIGALAKAFLTSAVGRSDLDEARIEETWSRLLEAIDDLARHQPHFDVLRSGADDVAAAGAPEWADRMRSLAVVDGVDAQTPSGWREAWDWAAAQRYLADLDQRDHVAALARERATLDASVAKGFEQVVRERTFYALANSMTGPVRAALMMFATALRRIGKGTGKGALRHRRDARKAMAACYDGIPCWIMPSWRVAEQLPGELGTFDLVVMDEASQSDIKEVTALLRGRKILVVGDDKQVSPTAAFIDNAKIDRLERTFLTNQPFKTLLLPGASLYDLAKVMFPDKFVMLREHFRCVEPIIRFSTQFYTEALVPLRIPTAHERIDPPLVDIYVPDGRRTGDKINRREAEVIVDEVVRIVGNPLLSRVGDGERWRSIGAISLIGSKQAGLINRMLLEALGEEMVLRHRIACGDSATFQGNERDVIFLSMVADPASKQAQTALHFEQRFNVAMSRARDRMYLVRSVREEELKPDDLKAKVLRHFRDPMKGSKRPEGDPSSLCDSDFERAVLRRLLDRGYRVTPQVGAMGYRIDLVVEGAGDRRLAVECDGDQYHGPERWADDMARQRVLERVGWRFWRCWASSFTIDPDGCMAELFAVLDANGIQPTTEDARPERYTELRIAEPRPVRTTGGTDAPDPTLRGNAENGIKVGDSIVVRFLDDNKTTSFVLSRDRHDPVNGLVGAETPFGKQLLGSDEEDELEVEAEGRSRRILIVRTARERVSLH